MHGVDDLLIRLRLELLALAVGLRLRRDARAQVDGLLLVARVLMLGDHGAVEGEVLEGDGVYAAHSGRIELEDHVDLPVGLLGLELCRRGDEIALLDLEGVCGDRLRLRIPVLHGP